MKKERRGIKKYKPRPRTHTKELQKQQLSDMEHLLNLDLGSLLVLNEEGTEKQKLRAKEKLRSHIKKYGGDMEKLAREVGPDVTDVTKEFIKSALIVLQDIDSIDQSKIANHHKISIFLEQMLSEKLGPS